MLNGIFWVLRSGASDNNQQDIGRSRGGLTSRIHAVVDANGLPIHLALTPGEAHDDKSAKSNGVNNLPK